MGKICRVGIYNCSILVMLLVLWNADCSYLSSKHVLHTSDGVAYRLCRVLKKSRKLKSVLTNFVHLFNFFAPHLSKSWKSQNFFMY